MDVLSDQLFDDTWLRILTSVEAYTRISPAIVTKKSYRAEDVVNPLEQVTRKYGVSNETCVDNGP